MERERLSLREALDADRLEDFIRQEEARGVVADSAAFDRLVATAVKQPQSADRTSRSASGDGSSGT